MAESQPTKAKVLRIKLTPAQEAQTLEQRKLVIEKTVEANAAAVEERPTVKPKLVIAPKAGTVQSPAPVAQSVAEAAQAVLIPEVLSPEPQTITITIEDLANIINSAATGTPMRLARELSRADSSAERIMDDTLGAVGDGAQRMANGVRDILGGAIEVVTLGRSRRRR